MVKYLLFFLMELEILQRSGTPNKKKQVSNHLSFIVPIFVFLFDLMMVIFL